MDSFTPASALGAPVQALVVGGGLTGVAAAIVCARAGLQTVHLAPPAPPDRRTSALMQPSVDFLRSAGLIDAPEAIGHPLTRIRIIDATDRLIRAPETLFDAAEIGLAAFGWNFPNIKLMERFQSVAETLPNLEVLPLGATGIRRDGNTYHVTLSDGSELKAELVVGADGKKSLVRSVGGFTVREHAFTQSALVCDLELGRPLDGTSVEFHYPQGPFTLVPAGGTRANLVWIDDHAVLDAIRSSGPEQLQAQINHKSQHLFGRISVVTPAFVFPLSTLSVHRAGQDGIALVGEAAHAFPPIGAQGLNLGLRDVADLAGAVAAADPARPTWSVEAAQSYASRRAADLGRTGGMVDALFRSLITDLLPAQALRASGLWALRLAPSLRRRAFGLGMGVGSRA